MFQHILFPTDGSAFGPSLVPLLREILPAEAHVTVLHVFHAPTRGAIRFADEWPLELAATQRAAQAIVDGEKGELELAGIEPVSTATFEGAPGPTICNVADLLDCDAIFMGTHGDSGNSMLNVGSVSAHVLSHASVPVILLHPVPRPDEEAEQAAVPAATAKFSSFPRCPRVAQAIV